MKIFVAMNLTSHLPDDARSWIPICELQSYGISSYYFDDQATVITRQ